MRQLFRQFLGRRLRPLVQRLFFEDLIRKTANFNNVTWLGNPIWQNVLDLWVIQEALAEIKPELLIECGTNRGGSSLFYANLFDLMGHGSVVTVDVEKLHDLSHPRVTYLLGSSTAPVIVAQIRARAAACRGPVMVILDSDHSERHVRAELAAYAEMVTPGSYCLVQDGCVDVLPMFANGRPGPLPAIEDFLATTRDFEVDLERVGKFYITHHPKGWLRRKATPPKT